MDFYIKKYKDVSRQPIEKIKRMQGLRAKDILQPYRPDGRINADYIRHYGAKNLSISDSDIRFLEKSGNRNLIPKILDAQNS